MNPTIQKICVCIGVIVTIATGIGIYHGFISNVASADDVKRIEVKIDKYIISQEVRQLQQRIWDIEDRYGSDPEKMPFEWKNEYRCIQHDLQKERIKLQGLKGKQ